MKETFVKKLKANPVIAAVKDLDNLDRALDSDCEIVFLLSGNIFNLEQLVQKVKSRGKMIFIHVDLIDGFSRDATAL